jgi:hypothetical protein
MFIIAGLWLTPPLKVFRLQGFRCLPLQPQRLLALLL